MVQRDTLVISIVFKKLKHASHLTSINIHWHVPHYFLYILPNSTRSVYPCQNKFQPPKTGSVTVTLVIAFDNIIVLERYARCSISYIPLGLCSCVGHKPNKYSLMAKMCDSIFIQLWP